MTDNPLRQYFRKPAVYMKLPSGGKGYPEGALDMPPNGEFPIYPMTALDEITARTPDALFNGSAVVDIIKSCVPNIKDPWSVTNVDLDPILIAIRAASMGDNMEFETNCPSCEEVSKYDINLPGLLLNFKPMDYDAPLVLGDVTVKFKPMNYTEINKANLAQFELQKLLEIVLNEQDDATREARSSDALARINKMTFELIANTIEYIKIPNATVFEREFMIEFLENCDKNSYDKIRDYSIELKQSTENKPLHIKCTHCGHEYDQGFSVNVSDFFA